MRIEIPEKLTPTRATNFANYIEQCAEEDEFVYDFKNMQHCHPYGLLVVASAIRNNKRRFPNAAHRLEHILDTQGGQFCYFDQCQRTVNVSCEPERDCDLP